MIHAWRNLDHPPIWDDGWPDHGRLTLGRCDGYSPAELYIADGPDPKILVADELLVGLANGGVHPDITLEWPKLTFRAREYASLDAPVRTLIYIVGEFNAELNAWWCQWPD